MKKEQPQIRKTSNLAIFKRMAGNRPISESRIKALEDKVKSYGWLIENFPILTNERLEVVDGQHRLEYARRKGLPVSYTIRAGLSEAAPANLNNTNTAWTLRDYIQHYAELGYPAYVAMKALLDRWSGEFDVSTLAQALTGCQRNGATFKSGLLTCEDDGEAKAEQALEWLHSIRPMLRGIVGHAKYYNQALLFCRGLPGFCPERMFEKLTQYQTDIVPVATVAQAVDVLEAVYNKRNREKLYLTEEYKKYLHNRQMAYKKEKRHT